MKKLPLPIDEFLDSIAAATAQNSRVIIEAPPGTGKTTRVAPHLLKIWNQAVAERSQPGNLAEQGQILLLQPRRIAARSTAARIAAELQSKLGGTVGYQVRFDSQVSRDTRLIAMTPGILLRKLQHDSVLDGVRAVVLDEFHERSLEYDLLLGMLLRLQTELREDLKLIVMSATLDTESLEQFLSSFGGSPPAKIQVPGRTFPVDVAYTKFRESRHNGRPVSITRRITESATEKVKEALTKTEGDILVFLPGVGEINQCANLLRSEADKFDLHLFKLYGDLQPQEQDQVLAPSDRRKVILSTNIAETSLTIDGVRVVIDSGMARVQRFDSAHGLNRLQLEPISQASAEQRAGRAGRTAPGVCYRLWDEITDRSRPPHLEPEVHRVDLSGGLLQLLCWGESDILAFPWITPPRQATIEQAMSVLELIGALERDASRSEMNSQDSREESTGQLVGAKPSSIGRALVQLPVHPRLARLLVEGKRLGVPWAAALASALLSERDVFERFQPSSGNSPPAYSARRNGNNSSSDSRNTTAGILGCDIALRVEAMQEFIHSGATHRKSSSPEIKPHAAYNVKRVAEQFLRLVHNGEQTADNQTDKTIYDDCLAQALLAAFPDRLAKRRSAGDTKGVMVGGRGVKLESNSDVRKAELFLCLDVDAGNTEAKVRQASGIAQEWLTQDKMRTANERFFNPTSQAIVTRRRTYWLDLQLSEQPAETPADEATATMLAVEASKRFDRLLPAKDKELTSWIARVQWLANEAPDYDLPMLTSETLAPVLEGWCFGMRSLQELKKLPWKSLLPSLLDGPQRQILDREAPEQFTLPSGRKVMLQYELGKPPILAARIQEFFGMKTTPRLAGGRVPILLHLLAPNQRCQQVTEDLESFWKNTYPVIRKELRGRYPKHAWPEDPAAQAGKSTK